MGMFTFLAAEAPRDLWTIMINWVNGSVMNFGWAILLATIIVKLIMTPLDFLVKLSTKKQMLVQQKLKPQISKLQKKYGSDQQALKVQQQALYKREGLNVGAGCLIMIVNLVLTMVVFFTFYSSLRKVSAYQAINEYEQIEASYTDAFYNSLISSGDISITDKDSANVWWVDFQEAKEYTDNEENKQAADYNDKLAIVNQKYAIAKQATDAGNTAAVAKYNEIKSSWLWVENIWRADAPISPFPYYNELQSSANSGGYGEYVNANIKEASYNAIANEINASTNRKNGYYILAILAALLTFLSQWVSELHNKLKSKKARLLTDSTKTADAGAGMSMKIMKFVMPIIMLLFVFSSSATFGLYILASNLTSLLFGEIITLIVDAITKKKRLEVEEELEKEANRLIKKGKLQE